MEQIETPRYFKGASNSWEVAKVTVENDSIWLERTWRGRPYPTSLTGDVFKTTIGIKFNVVSHSPSELKSYFRDLTHQRGWIECTYEEFLRGLLQ